MLNEKDSIRLLKTRVPSIDGSLAGEIAEELGGLPLALEQAAAFLNKTQISASEYLQLFRTRQADMLNEGKLADRQDTIGTLWDLSLERLATERLATAQLMDYCAYMAPVPIPLDLFTNHPEQLPAELGAAARDALAFNHVIESIVDYSLAKRTRAGLQLHRLAQAAIRARHQMYDNIELPGSGRRTTQAQPATPDRNPLVAVLALLLAEAPAHVFGLPESWPIWSVLLPHVLACTEHFEESIQGEANVGAMLDCSWLLDRAGTYLQTQGRYWDAVELLRRSVSMGEAVSGPDQPDVATHLSTLARVLWDLGDLAEARPLAERALTISEAALGPDHPDIAIRLGNLAMVLQDQGDTAGARPLVERALAISEAALGPDHPDVAIRLSNLAWVLRDLGDPAQARPLAERALAIHEATLGPDHPDIAIRLSNLASVLQDLGDPAQARPLAERALGISEAALGPDHPDIAISLSNLASVLQDLGDADGARPLAERAQTIAAKCASDRNPRLASGLQWVRWR